jgi:hypothetical protein
MQDIKCRLFREFELSCSSRARMFSFFWFEHQNLTVLLKRIMEKEKV